MLTSDCRVATVRSEPDMIGLFKLIFQVWINYYLSLRMNISILLFQLIWIGSCRRFLNNFAFSAALLLCYPLLQRVMIIFPLCTMLSVGKCGLLPSLWFLYLIRSASSDTRWSSLFRDVPCTIVLLWYINKERRPYGAINIILTGCLHRL